MTRTNEEIAREAAPKVMYDTDTAQESVELILAALNEATAERDRVIAELKDRHLRLIATLSNGYPEAIPASERAWSQHVIAELHAKITRLQCARDSHLPPNFDR